MTKINLLTMRFSKATIFLALLQMVAITIAAQRTDTTAQIQVKANDNEVSFSSELRPLRQIAGAPQAFYTYFWEFGDGSFSFRENPTHIYKDTGTYETRLFATNNYDDGKAPKSRKPTRVPRKRVLYASNDHGSFFKQGGAIEMKVNRMPRPGEDMVLIMGYQNEGKSTAMNGSLILFYNEKQFRAKSFDLEEERTYNNETKSSISSVIAMAPANDLIETGSYIGLSGPAAESGNSTERFRAGKFTELIAAKQKLFRQNNTWRFAGLEKGDQKYFFLTLQTSPEMIKDTNGVVTLTGMFVPDDPNADLEEFSLELQIVASHDPNRMMLKNSRLNYRFTGQNKEMQYRVRFQNTGRGPATDIKIGIAVPPMLDPKSLEILDFYPRTGICDTSYAGQSCMARIISNDSIWFVFRNIYLPGLRQDGFNDPDSTVGFVKYRMQFNKELKKLPFDSRAAIVFNDQAPVYTNGAKGEFQPGKSIAPILGFNRPIANNKHPFDEEEHYWTIGVSLSPFSPYRKYLQVEAFLGQLKYPEQFVTFNTPNKDTVINSITHFLFQREVFASRKVIKLELVPLELRYNIIDWVGVGAGATVAFNAYTRYNVRERLFMRINPNPAVIIMEKTYKGSDYFTRFDAGLFGDVQVGKVRAGPVLGIRFLHYFINIQNRLIFYASWRL